MYLKETSVKATSPLKSFFSTALSLSFIVGSIDIISRKRSYPETPFCKVSVKLISFLTGSVKLFTYRRKVMSTVTSTIPLVMNTAPATITIIFIMVINAPSPEWKPPIYR